MWFSSGGNLKLLYCRYSWCHIFLVDLISCMSNIYIWFYFQLTCPCMYESHYWPRWQMSSKSRDLLVGLFHMKNNLKFVIHGKTTWHLSAWRMDIDNLKNCYFEIVILQNEHIKIMLYVDGLPIQTLTCFRCSHIYYSTSSLNWHDL